MVGDMTKCQDHGKCGFADPEVSYLGDEGYPEYLSGPEKSLRESVTDVTDVRPFQTISIER